ncbi:unnamed protein product [Leuciscus chuanchicus]
MPKEQKKKDKNDKRPNEEGKEGNSSTLAEHDYCGADMETEDGSGGKRSFEDTSDSPPLTPSKGEHQRKLSKQSPTATDILNAVQALHIRFDRQDDKMADLNKKLTDNSVMIASLAKSLEFQAGEVQECKGKIAGLENEALLLRKEVDMLKEKAREKDRYSRRWNLRIKGLKEAMGEDIRNAVVKLLGRIAPEWADVMEHSVDTVHRLGRQEDGRNRQVIVQFTRRIHRDGIWRKSKESSICKTEGIRFAEDLSKEDRLEREKLWPKISQARNAGQKAYYRGAYGYIDGRRILAVES